VAEESRPTAPRDSAAPGRRMILRASPCPEALSPIESEYTFFTMAEYHDTFFTMDP
jgi:hypothetical protein